MCTFLGTAGKINENDVDANITQYMSTDGKLTIADNTSTYINYATTYALAADKYIVLEKAGRFNGLHKIESIGDNTGTKNKIILTTKIISLTFNISSKFTSPKSISSSGSVSGSPI